MKILLIEDNEPARYTEKVLLERLGQEIVGEAGDAKSAIAAYLALKPDIVFLDLILPGRSGVDILADLRRINPLVRVVVVTAVDQRELDSQLRESGVEAVLLKPFSYEELKTLVAGLEARS